MKGKFAGFVLALLISVLSAFAQVPNAETIALTNAAQALAGMRFDSGTPISIRARVSTLVWPEGSAGMILVEAVGTAEKYAFSTARVADMAKQGFTRFALKPGEEVIVTGVLANGSPKIGPGFNAARADMVTRSNGGTHVFDRTRLPVAESK
jgi:hypothetical protein